MDDSLTSTASSRHTMPASNGANGFSVSAAMLTDPKALKRHLANGILPSFQSNSSSLAPRSSSEPPTSHSSLSAPVTPKSFTRTSKDDAYYVSEGKGRKPAMPQASGQAPLNQLDPRRLLDPVNFNNSNRSRKVREPSTEFTSSGSPRPAQSSLHQQNCGTPKINNNELHKRDHEDYEGQGMGSLIERIHNITQREERPPKKQKIEAFNDEKDKNTFGGGGKGGEIGEYMRQKKKEGLEESGPAAAVVDLTGGDDEEEVTMISDSGQKEVCYGRIDSTRVHAHSIPCPSGKAVYLSKGQWPSMRLALRRHPGKDNIIRVIDPTGKDFGNVDVRTSLGLAKIMDSKNPKFRAQARLNPRNRKTDEYPGKDCSEYFDMTINLYGPQNKAITMGRFLSQRNIWLKTPFMVDANIEVLNPHAQTNATPRTSHNGVTNSSNAGSGSGYVARTVEEVRSDVIGVFDSLEQSENLPEMEPDPRVTTQLLSHQKQGLYFMTSKEKERIFSDKEEDNNSLWRLKFRPNGQRSYFNVITGNEERTKPPEVLGGILADMMGLGKTLSILALIVGSLDEAKQSGQQPVPGMDGENAQICSSKSTLLVCPLSTMANWEEQIANHIKPKTLKYYVYHGGNRLSNVDELSKFDVIITTYSIVSSDYMRRGRKKDVNPLFQTNFFRIVLDEAHMIREQSTRQSQAICALSALRRWAVTGTPVQNRLDDLGALIKFLRMKPFDEKGRFAQFILSPFKTADPEIVPKLRLLVDSITLRRLKDRIDLPSRRDEIVRLPFTEDEKVLYDWFAKDSQNKLRLIANEQRKSLGGRTYAHILRAIMRLRLICAHGRELLSEDDLKITEGFSLDNAINLDDDDNDRAALSSKLAYEMLILFKETDTDQCAQCQKRVEVKDTEETACDEDDVIGCMMPCYQMLCKDCMDGVKAALEQSSTKNHFQCPFCQQTLRTSFFELTRNGVEAAEEQRVMARENPRQAKIMGRYGGPHTKVRALIQALKDSEIESQSLPSSEQPIKSVVFSGWTANLDLIQIALEDNNIKYVRLDGKMSRGSRNSSLDAFRDDPEVCVILISITAGGLGLNLTSGSKVYVMEPQFNPAAEAQAVDRVHRLGQRREVFTYRYIMAESFEEKMLDLQRKKQNLADLSMNRGKLDKAENSKRKLEELRSLFK